MKQGMTLLIVTGMMLIFGVIMMVHLNAWEKRIKEEVMALARQECPDLMQPQNDPGKGKL